jgi:Transglycosylase SLT domain.
VTGVPTARCRHHLRRAVPLEDDVNSKDTIRGIAVTTGTAVAGAAVAAGLNVAGVLGDVTPSAALADTANATPPTRNARLVHTRHAWQKHQRVQTANQARKVRKDRAAKAVAAARGAREAASRSSTRTYAGDPRSIARNMMASRYGWNASQFSCLDSLWNRESGWNAHAANPSGAYGIPQALPGAKMSTMGADWRDNPATQIAWGLSYVKSSYGTPCGAWSAFQSKGWY